MNATQLLQVIAVSSAMTVALILLLRSVRQRLAAWWHSHLLPRHLKPRGVRRRTIKTDTGSAPHDPS